MTGPDDWQRVTKNNNLPHTCCPGTSDDDECTINSDNVYKTACVAKLDALFRKYGSMIGSIGLGIAGAQVSIDTLNSLGVIVNCFVIYYTNFIIQHSN